MAGSDGPRRTASLLPIAAPLVLGAALACASGGSPKPEPVMPEPASVQEPMSPEPMSPEEEASEPADAALPEEEPVPTDGDLPADEAAAQTPAEAPHKATDVVVISEGKAPDDAPVGLYEAAQEARRERGEAPRRSGSIVVTNETLEQHEPGGQISYGRTEESVPAAQPSATPPATAGEAREPSPADTTGATGGEGEAGTTAPTAERPLEERNPELYWRNRIREARLRWREAVEKVDELEGLSEQLRYDFYATDDPWLRDSSIKPAWDRTLVDLEEARQEVEFQKRTVEAILNEGRHAGALPGWLREGLELEPEETDRHRPGTFDEHSAIEPVEMEDDDDADGGDHP